jgi:hypothetical protein
VVAQHPPQHGHDSRAEAHTRLGGPGTALGAGERDPRKGYRSLYVGLPRSVSLIEALGERYPRAELCRVFGVKRRSVYDACTRLRRIDHQRVALRQLATELHLQSRGSAWARRLSAVLRIQGVMVGRFLPGRLMKEARVFSTQYRKHRNREADGESAIATNALDWQFTVSGFNQVWCGDVTCIWAGNRWIYLAAVMDLYARRIVAGHSPLGRTSNLQRGLCAWPSSPVVVRSS